MPPRRKPAAPPPKLKVTVEYLEEDWEVEIIVPSWAMHKLKGGEPNDRFEEEGGESMWELYVQDHGERAAKKAFEHKASKLAAEEKAKNDARLASLKKSFEAFDEDGSGYLTTDEVLEILTRMTGGGNALSEEDAQAFIDEFDRDGDGTLDVNEFIIAMGVVSDAADLDGDGVADMKDGEGAFDGKEAEFAEALAAGSTIQVAGMAGGSIAEGINEARRLQG